MPKADESLSEVQDAVLSAQIVDTHSAETTTDADLRTFDGKPSAGRELSSSNLLQRIATDQSSQDEAGSADIEEVEVSVPCALWFDSSLV
jgi:hypothetical protein